MKSIRQHIFEKLKVSKKYISDINLVDFVKCENLIEYNALLETLRKEIKENTKLAPIKQGSDKLYKLISSDPNIIYIFINERAFYIGTYDNMYYVFVDYRNKRIIVNTGDNYGFKEFMINDKELHDFGGIYYLPEYLEESYNELIKHAENYM